MFLLLVVFAIKNQCLLTPTQHSKLKFIGVSYEHFMSVRCRWVLIKGKRLLNHVIVWRANLMLSSVLREIVLFITGQARGRKNTAHWNCLLKFVLSVMFFLASLVLVELSSAFFYLFMPLGQTTSCWLLYFIICILCWILSVGNRVL